MAEPIDKQTRGATNLRIKFRSANLEDFIERYAVDVSRGGIFIRTREPLSVGSRLRLDFQLLEAGPLLEGEGTVVWIRQPDPARTEVTPGMGVRFDKLTPDSQTRLDKILAEKERLGQSGKAPGMSKTGAGMAVRRPTGAFTSLDASAKTAPPSAAPAPASPPSTPASAPAPGPARMTAPLASQQHPPAPPTSGFGRPRTTTGTMAALRSAPVPSGLFEAPTADDIDKALSVLEEKGPGPGPLPIPPPRVAEAPIHVADDASNEPTRVVSDPQEFAVHEAVTGKADGAVLPETGVPELSESAIEDLTAPVSADEEATMAASPAAFAAAERALVGAAPERNTPASALDAPLGAHLPTEAAPSPPSAPTQSPLRKRSIVIEPIGPTESGRFRTNATYHRPRKAGKRIAVLLVLAAAGGAGYMLRHRLRALIPTTEVAALPTPLPSPTPVPEPSPAVLPDAAVSAAEVDAAIAAVAEEAAGASGAPPAPAREHEKEKPAVTAAPAPEPAPDKAAAAEARHPKRKRAHTAAAEAQPAASTEKTAAPTSAGGPSAGAVPKGGPTAGAVPPRAERKRSPRMRPRRWPPPPRDRTPLRRARPKRLPRSRSPPSRSDRRPRAPR